MPFQIVRADYAKMDCDAVVISTSFCFTAMVDREGPDKRTTCQGGLQRLQARKKLGKIPAGTAKITPPGSYGMKARKIIYTVCPRKNDTNPKLSANKLSYMHSCYRSCLEIACKEKLKSVAFVLIGARNRGFDPETCLTVAISEILHFLSDPDHPERTAMKIFLTVFEPFELEAASKVLREKFVLPSVDIRMSNEDARLLQNEEYSSIRRRKKHEKEAHIIPDSTIQNDTIPSFRQKLYEYLRNKAVTGNDLYERLHQNGVLSRQTFYNIRQKKNYTPSKRIVLACAMTLGLTLKETQELLSSAGYAFQSADPSEMQIMKYFETLDFNHLENFRRENFTSKASVTKKTGLKKKRMWKYQRLSDYFANSREKTLLLTFSQIEDILGFHFPESYQTNRTMWYPRAGSRVLADAWIAHGYRLIHIDVEKRIAEFEVDGFE